MTPHPEPPPSGLPHSEGPESGLDSKLLERYWLREATTDEAATVAAWIAANPGRWQRYEAFRRHLTRPVTEDVSDADVRRVVSAVLATTHPSSRRDSQHDAQHDAPRRARHSTRRMTWMAVAGAMAGVAGVIGIGLTVARRARVQDGPMATYVTGNGQRATIDLPDGSVVSLNVASRLEVPANYLNGHRALRLHGEGLFTVAHATARPFTVTAGGITTRVLGTSFVVRHYDADRVTTVAVRDGRVAVGKTVLGAMQLARVTPSGEIRIDATDSARFGFPSGLLAIDRQPLSDAIPELDRWYNADLRLSSPELGQREIKGHLVPGSLGDLKELMEMMGFRVVRDGRTLTLYPRAE